MVTMSPLVILVNVAPAASGRGAAIQFCRTARRSSRATGNLNRTLFGRWE